MVKALGITHLTFGNHRYGPCKHFKRWTANVCNANDQNFNILLKEAFNYTCTLQEIFFNESDQLGSLTNNWFDFSSLASMSIFTESKYKTCKPRHLGTSTSTSRPSFQLSTPRQVFCFQNRWKNGRQSERKPTYPIGMADHNRRGAPESTSRQRSDFRQKTMHLQSPKVLTWCRQEILHPKRSFHRAIPLPKPPSPPNGTP